jgi:hypothetical protein
MYIRELQRAHTTCKIGPCQLPTERSVSFSISKLHFSPFFTDIDQLEKFKFCGLASACNRRDWGYGAGLPDFSFKTIPKPEKMYQANTKCTKWP